MKKKTKISLKFDQGKPDLSLLPYEALEEVAYVLMHGARVYGRYNWDTSGLEWTRLSSATDRHKGKFMDKHERIDFDPTCRGCKNPPCDKHTHRHHIASSIANLLFLLSYDLRGKTDKDNRRSLFISKAKKK